MHDPRVPAVDCNFEIQTPWGNLLLNLVLMEALWRAGSDVGSCTGDRDRRPMMSMMARRLGLCSTRSQTPLVSFTGDGAYDQAYVYDTVAKYHPEADVIAPRRSSAVPGKVAETTPTQRDRHLQSTAQYGRMGWQASSEVAPNDAGSTTEVPSRRALIRLSVDILV